MNQAASASADDESPNLTLLPPAAFDARRHLIRINGNKEYLPVAARVAWFRHDHPTWGIVSQIIEINMEKQFALFSASIFDGDGKIIATGTKYENVRGFGDFIEKAETGAIGRALANAGYGTQFAPEMDELNDPCDGPREPKGKGRPGDAASGSQGNRCSEEGCNALLTPSQITTSMTKFQRQLCPKHQSQAARSAASGR